jgi:peptidoglycan hydrolase-like protein with peptidoglycan-binding domain
VKARVGIGTGLLCLLVAGCGGSGGNGGESSASTAASTPSSAATTAAPPGGKQSKGVKLWFTSGEQFQTVDRKLPASGSKLRPAVEALLAGPTEAERRGEVKTRTQIPAGVSLKKLTVADDGTAVVDVSHRFLAGVPAQPQKRTPVERRTLNARLGQLTYTVTQFDQVNSAKVVSGGIGVDPDLTRGDYSKPEGGPKPIVKPKGRRLPGTRQVQTKLVELGYLAKNGIDGLDGYQTQQAVIAFQSWEGLGRDGVVGPITSAALRTAHRPKPQAGGPSRRIEVYRDKGVALLIRDRRTIRAIHVSAGKPSTPTPSGTYHVFRKELRSWSVPFSTWLPFASYFNAGIAFHEYPDVPTYPASHGCVRVPAPDAKRVYDFARLGTAVVVI